MSQRNIWAPFNAIESNSFREILFNRTMNDYPLNEYENSVIPEKPGPPKIGLFQNLLQHKLSIKMGKSVNSSTVSNVNDSISFINISDINYGNLISMTRTSNQTLDSLWVTVFGFPPGALNLVLSHLANCGWIREKNVPLQGNWVHIKFNYLSEVSRALALNCTQINNNIMIGVAPYKPKITVYPSMARSLRHSYNPKTSQASTQTSALPEKPTGIIIKALEYICGW